MFCESILWRMGYSLDFGVNVTPPIISKEHCVEKTLSELTEAVSFSSHYSGTQMPIKSSPEVLSSGGWSSGQAASEETRRSSKAPQNLHQSQAIPVNRNISPEVDIPGQVKPSGEAFLVPSSCQSICKNYSDLHIGGDLVLPLSASTGDLTAGSSIDIADGPFLQSCEIPPAMESPRPSLESPQKFLLSNCWRMGSGKERSFLFLGERPLSNAQLNEYLEHKVLDLYKQYMMEAMVNNGSPSAILASEIILTNVDQITQQLSREQNLEAAKAKDMVISCLLRVASGLQSSEISTPQLQISKDII